MQNQGIHVVWNGQDIVVGPRNSSENFISLEFLKQELAETTGVVKEGQKLILKGKSLVDDDLQLSTLMGEKIMLVGTTVKAIEELNQREIEIQREQTIRECRFEVSIRGRNGRHIEPSSNYGFGHLATLPNLPQQDRAKALLQDLVGDCFAVRVSSKQRML